MVTRIVYGLPLVLALWPTTLFAQHVLLDRWDVGYVENWAPEPTTHLLAEDVPVGLTFWELLSETDSSEIQLARPWKTTHSHQLPETDWAEIEGSLWHTVPVEYTASFDLSRPLRQAGPLIIQLDGVDTHASVYVNDEKVGTCDNAFRRWSFPIAGSIHKKNNTVRIVLEPPLSVGEAKQREQVHPLPGAPIRAVTRKPQYQFGWDWGPAVPSMGLTGAVRILPANTFSAEATFHTMGFFTEGRSISAQQPPVNASMALDLKVQSLPPSNSPGTLTVRTEDQTWVFDVPCAAADTTFRYEFSLDHPTLWWPHNLGTPHLTPFDLELRMDETTKRWTEQVGVRMVQLTGSVAEAAPFVLSINQQPIFCKGANLIPQHVNPHRTTVEEDRQVVREALDANMNMLRVWGGGTYAQDSFYHACDSAGILVWQDFMFACAMYPGDSAFVANVRVEAEEHVRRLAHHPSVVLWCGNNENNEGWHRWGWQAGLTETEQAAAWRSYERLFMEVLPEVVAAHSSLPYWESSPSLGRGDERYTECGDAHDWWVWHDAAPFEHFRRAVPRFMSEFGFQSYPSRHVIDKMVADSQAQLGHPSIAKHQKHHRGEALIRSYMERDFGLVPEDLDEFIYLSQVQQARGIGMGMRAHRMAQPHCMGSLFWQLNDCWPAISWSSIDYLGIRKALHFEARRRFAAVMTDVEIVEDTLEVGVFKPMASLLRGESSDNGWDDAMWEALVEIKALDGALLVHLPLTKRDLVDGKNTFAQFPMKAMESTGLEPGEWYVKVTVNVAGEQLAQEMFLPELPALDALPEVTLNVSTDPNFDGTYDLSIGSTGPAFWVEITSDVPGNFSDNFFHMDGNARLITFEPLAGQSNRPHFTVRCLNNLR